jgi:hypothetical protein
LLLKRSLSSLVGRQRETVQQRKNGSGTISDGSVLRCGMRRPGKETLLKEAIADAETGLEDLGRK